MLEEKAQELLETKDLIEKTKGARTVAHDVFCTALGKLPGYSELMEKHSNEDSALADKIFDLEQAKTLLQSDVLSAMTEKTHKLECATLTKRITRKLVVALPHDLFNMLPVGLKNKIKYSFPGSDIIKAADIGAIDLSGIAEITETESLAVKKN